jgi:hypothetical protein
MIRLIERRVVVLRRLLDTMFKAPPFAQGLPHAFAKLGRTLPQNGRNNLVDDMLDAHGSLRAGKFKGEMKTYAAIS